MKFVLNKTYGGFSLTKADVNYLKNAGVLEQDTYVYWNIERNNPVLVEGFRSGVITGEDHSQLEIVEIPDEVTDYMIDEYDGWEQIIYVIDGKIHIK